MLKAAIVGCGRIASGFDDDPKRAGSVATHAGAYTHNKQTKLIAAADVNKGKLAAFGQKWQVSALYGSYQEMLEKEQIDILSICTWSSSHYEICQAAVKVGVKIIFCEKPIAASLAQADKMVKLCQENNVILAINHSRRWDKMHQQIKAYIDQGKLGDIQHVSAYYTAGIANTGTHLIDLLNYLFGGVSWVWSNFDGKEELADPSVDVYLFFKKGFSATLHGLDVKNYLIFEIDIYGSKGRLRIENSGFDAACWRATDHPKFPGYKSLQAHSEDFDEGLQNTMMSAIDDLINCLKTGRQPQSSGLDGLAAFELICAIFESGKVRNGQKLTLPLTDRGKYTINSR